MTMLRSSSKDKSTGIHMGIGMGIHVGIGTGIRVGIRMDIGAGRLYEQVTVVRCGLCLLLCGTLVLVATVVMAVIAMMITPAAATATQEVTLPRWGNVMAMCDSNKARISVADNAGAGTTTEQFAHTVGLHCGGKGRMRARALLGPLKCPEEGVRC